MEPRARRLCGEDERIKSTLARRFGGVKEVAMTAGRLS